MSSITLSASTRQNLLSLQDTASLLSTTQSRLSTGKKVNSALDNPTNFFTSQSLTARSSDLSNLLDGISNGVQVIKAANQGITSITKLIDTAKSTAQQALADKTGGSSGATGGDKAQAAKVIGTATLANLGQTDAAGKTTFDLSSPSKDASLDISLDGGATKTTIRLDSNALAGKGLDLSKVTGEQLLAAIDTQIGASSALKGKVEVGVGSDGRLAFNTTAAGAGTRISVAGSADSTIDIGYGRSSIPPTPATVTAAAALSPNTDFSNGASASLTISDGSTNVAITLDKDSLLSDGVTKLGTSASQANIKAAIQYQLAQAGSGITVDLDAGKLVFTSSDSGPNAAISVTAGADSTIGGVTGATGIGFTTFNNSGATSVAPRDLPASASSAGALAGAPTTSVGAAGVTTFSKVLSGSLAIPAGLETRFAVLGKTVTLNASSGTGTGSNTLATNSTAADIADAINVQLRAGTPSTVTAAADSNGRITFTDSNQANAAPNVTGVSDYLGVFATPPKTQFAATFGGATFDLSGSKAATFKVEQGATTKTITIDAAAPKSGAATLGNNGTNAVSAADVLDSINKQFADGGSPFRAYVDSNNKLNIVGDGSSNTGLTITNAADTTQSGSAIFANVNAGASGTAASQSATTTAAKATTTATNVATTLSSTSFGTGGHTTFTVGGTSVTIDANALYDVNPAHTLQSDPTKLAQAINVKLAAAGNTGVTASLDNAGKLTFTNAAGGSTPPALVLTGGSNTDQLGLFGTPARTSLTGNLSTLLVNGNLDLDGGKSASFTVGNQSVTISAAATDGNGGSGTLGSTPSLASMLKSVNSQLSGSGFSAYIDNQNRLTFVSANNQASAPSISSTGLTDTIGLGLGTAASTTAGTAAATIASGPDAGRIDLSNGKSSSFTITDGTDPVTVTINQNSVGSDGITKIGPAATKADVAAAIQRQLDQAAQRVDAKVSFDNSGKLTVTSTAVGSQARVSLTGISDTAQLGIGSNAPTNGTFTPGNGRAATGVSASGAEATDGSSKASIVGSEKPATFDFTGKDASFTLKLGDGPLKTISVNSSKFGNPNSVNQSAIAQAINDQIAADTGLAGKVSASYVNNKLVLSTTAAGSDQKLAVTAAQVTPGGTTGLDIGFGVSGSGATAQTASGTDVGGSKGVSSVRSTLATQFNQILQQITQQAQDSGYNGLNLLFRNSNSAADNTLHIAFNEKNTAALDIGGVKFDATGLGLDTITGGFQTDTEITAAIEKLTSATSQLRTQSSTFGANLSVVQNRQDFSKAMINILDTGAGNLVNADLNEEAANSQALSTRNSLAVSALSLANQAQQGILQLLR